MPVQDYFSIDDILAGEPRVFCTFRVRGRTLGHLDPHSNAENWIDHPDKENISGLANTNSDSDTLGSPRLSGTDLRIGHRIALPFWLCESLAERGIVDADLPKCYGARMRNELKADPSSVSLHRKSPYFYSLGLSLARTLRDTTLISVLLAAFGNRCWNSVDNAVYGIAVGKGADLIAKLDIRERDIFFASHGVNIALNRWKERTSDKITRSRSVLGKRRSPSSVFAESSPLTPRQRTG